VDGNGNNPTERMLGLARNVAGRYAGPLECSSVGSGMEMKTSVSNGTPTLKMVWRIAPRRSFLPEDNFFLTSSSVQSTVPNRQPCFNYF
jgi:hypothetical protein